jgi:hypothetical protein
MSIFVKNVTSKKPNVQPAPQKSISDILTINLI